MVLTFAYEFLRTVHAERFGRASTLRAEAQAGGWIDFYPDPLTAHSSGHAFFGRHGVFRAEFNARAQFAAASLSEFYAEGKRMTADWTVVVLIGDRPCEFRSPFDAAVCTWRVLLLDAETGHGHRRRKEMRLSAQLARMNRCDNAEPVNGSIAVRTVYADRPQQTEAAPGIPEALAAAIAMSNKYCLLLATVDDWSLVVARGVSAAPYWLWKDEANPRHEGHRESPWYGACGTGFWPDPGAEGRGADALRGDGSPP